jgi:hypothetical protein
MIPLIIFSAFLIVLGYFLSTLKPKPNKESLDWVGGLIAGAGVILFLALFSAYMS